MTLNAGTNAEKASLRGQSAKGSGDPGCPRHHSSIEGTLSVGSHRSESLPSLGSHRPKSVGATRKSIACYSGEYPIHADLETTTSLKVTLPWVTQEFEETRALMGEDYWPYGLGRNRKELEAVMRYVDEQGLVKRRLKFEELFHPSTLDLEEATA